MPSATPAPLHTPDPERSVDVFPDEQMVIDLTHSLTPRLPQLADADVEDLVRTALDELAPVRVTAYLGVLVERRLRSQIPAQRV